MWLVVAAGGCNDETCAQSLCGCWEDVVVRLELRVVDQDGDPVEAMDVICINEDRALASTNTDGVVSTMLDTRLSASCGTERCNSLTLRDPTGRCLGTQSTLMALNDSVVTVDCGAAGDDDDSAF